MRLDFIENINAYGEHVVRLFDTNSAEATRLYEAIEQNLIKEKKDLHLSTLEFIEPRNCQLSLFVSDEDLGIMTRNKVDFICVLTVEGYQELLKRLAPFRTKETKAHQFLYEIDNEIDFLYSPAGTW